MQVPTCWTEELALPQTLLILESLAHDHLKLGGPVGAHLGQLLRDHKWADLLDYDLDPSSEDWDVYHLINCRQGLGFFQKLEDLELGLDKEAVAKEKFLESERDCRATNAFLRAAPQTLSKVPVVVRLIEIARRKIRFVLGVCPKADKLRMHFGPGATTAITKRAASPESKFASGFQCSADMFASGLLPTYLRQAPHWLDAFDLKLDQGEVKDHYSVVECELVPGKLVCVPKSAKTYRTILVEPNLNGFVQQGIRHAMEARLQAAGLATRDQSRNALMARMGSISNCLATLDLSSASDLISYELVKALLPGDWFRLLCSARTSNAEVDGDVIPLEKFSSMGNAYTFPLETLIFWAISTAALDLYEVSYSADEVAVYGDDIIVPSCGHKHVTWALEVLGFRLNRSKSYVSGPFRESCGHDYYKGIDVRPYYQKHLVSGQTLFVLHNYYVRQLNFEMASKVLDFIPIELRLFGPDGYGDGHLLSENWPRRRKASWLNKGYSGCFFETFSLRPRREISRYPGDWVTPLYTVYVSGRDRIHEKVNVLEAPAPLHFAKDGRPYWTYPGSSGYKKVSIYTLAG